MKRPLEDDIHDGVQKKAVHYRDTLFRTTLAEHLGAHRLACESCTFGDSMESAATKIITASRQVIDTMVRDNAARELACAEAHAREIADLKEQLARARSSTTITFAKLKAHWASQSCVACSEVYSYHHAPSPSRVAVDACVPDMCCTQCGAIYHAACFMRVIGATTDLLVNRRCTVCAHQFILVDDQTEATSPFGDERLIDRTVEVDDDGFPMINPDYRTAELARRAREAAKRLEDAGPEPRLEDASHFPVFVFPPAPPQQQHPPVPLQLPLPVLMHPAAPQPQPQPQAQPQPVPVIDLTRGDSDDDDESEYAPSSSDEDDDA